MNIRFFLSDDTGAVTIDWTVLAAALTAVGAALTFEISQGLNDHSNDMRGELQDPHFNTDWFDNVAVLPPSMQEPTSGLPSVE